MAFAWLVRNASYHSWRARDRSELNPVREGKGMHCPNCGAENPEKAKFCVECGSAIIRRCSSCGSVRQPLLGQQLFLGDNRIVDLPLFAFQVLTMLPVVQVANEGVGID